LLPISENISDIFENISDIFENISDIFERHKVQISGNSFQ